MSDSTKTTAIIDSNDPRAILVAYINADCMGGWPNDDAEAFEAAVRAEAASCYGISEDDVETIDIERL